MGGPGTAIDVPLGHKDAAYVRSHFDAMEVRVADAPREREIVVVIAVTDSGRPLARIGGLAKARDQGRRRVAVDDQRYFTISGTRSAGGVLRLRPMRTMPSIITMPMPGRSPIPIA